MKRIAKILTCMLLTVLIILPIGSFAVETADTKDIKEGKCGANAFWKLDMSTGELTVYGTGPTDHFNVYPLEDIEYDPQATMSYNKKLPLPDFHKYRENILKIKVEEGITELGRGLFKNLDNCVSAKLPDTLTVIHPACFAFQDSLEEVNLPESLTRIGKVAFKGCPLNAVSWPSNVTVMEDGALALRGEVDNLIIPSTITHVGSTFHPSLITARKIFLPNSLNNSYCDFQSFTVLEEIVFEEGFTYIDVRLPSEGEGCVKLIVPSTVTGLSDTFINTAGKNDGFWHPLYQTYEICFCGTDEEWNNIVAKLSDDVKNVLNTQITVTTNYTYDFSVYKTDGNIFLTDEELYDTEIGDTKSETTEVSVTSETTSNVDTKLFETTNVIVDGEFPETGMEIKIVVVVVVLCIALLSTALIIKTRRKNR